MSTSYKAVFALSILMIFIVIIGGAMSGSKSVGFGIWYWGYTAWKMHKRDNDSLVSLQKIMLWFQAIAFSVALAVLLLPDPDIRRYLDITPLGLIIIAALSMGLTYILYKFFLGQQNDSSYSSASVAESPIADIYWEQALRELDTVRHEATWAKAMAGADGDDGKTKALYLKLRASELQHARRASQMHSEKSNEESGRAGAMGPPISTKPLGGSILRKERIGNIAIATLVFLLGAYLIKEFAISPGERSPSNVKSSSEAYWEDGGKKYRLGALYQRTSSTLDCQEIIGPESFKTHISGDNITIGNRTPFRISEKTPETIFFYSETPIGKSSARIDVSGFIDLRDGMGQITSGNVYIFRCREQPPN
jgi:hypothetical protein